MAVDMKQCRTCGKDSPLSEYRRYASGTVKPNCPACVAIYQKAHRQPVNKAPDYTPDCTQMRHPDPAFMEANVLRLIKEYAKKVEIAYSCKKGTEAYIVDRVIGEML